MTDDPRPARPFGAPGPDDETTAVPTDHHAASPWDRQPLAASSGPAPEPASVPAVASVPAPVAPVAVRPRSGGAGLLVNLLLGVAVLVAVGGIAFAVGRGTAPISAAADGKATNGGLVNGGGPLGGGPVGGGPGGEVSLQGTVTAISAESITLQLANGQTVTIPIDAKTTYHQRESATAAQVSTGSTVMVEVQGGFRGNGAGNQGKGNGNGGPAASGQPGRTFPAATSITLVPAGS